MENHKIQILGRYYTLKGIEDKEYIDKLAQFIDQHMRQIADATGTVDTQKIAILAALKIADQLFRLKEDQAQHDLSLERNLDAIGEQISMMLEITHSEQKV